MDTPKTVGEIKKDSFGKIYWRKVPYPVISVEFMNGELFDKASQSELSMLEVHVPAAVVDHFIGCRTEFLATARPVITKQL